MTVADLLRRVLRVAGVDAVYGAALEGIAVVPAPVPGVATLLAAAHERVHGMTAAVHLGDGVLRVGPPQALTSTVITITTVDDLCALPGRGLGVDGAVELHLEVDLGGPASDRAVDLPPPVDRWLDADPNYLARLEQSVSPVVLAGPGVVRARAVAGLHALATAGDLGVLNTWGAKGVFDWRSRHHWATVGLQARDFELGGLGEADLIVATGVDAQEAPSSCWQLAPSITVAPGALAPLAERWRRPGRELVVPPLRAQLAAVTQEGWSVTTSPLPPSRATLHYGQRLGAGGLVAADPGVAGYWVARTFATTELGGAQVPAEADAAGFAAACALVARLRRPARVVLAVVDGPPADRVHEVVDVAAGLGVGIGVEVWQPDGAALDADAHEHRLGALVVAERPTFATLAVDGAQLTRMIDVAGPVVAWTR